MKTVMHFVLSVLLFPFKGVLKLIQNKMNFFRTYKLKILIAKVLRIIRTINGSASSVEFPDTFYYAASPEKCKNIGFIDHSYHYKTVSPSFFLDLLKQQYNVQVIWDSQWNGGKFPSIDRINQQDFDILILWQVMIYYHPEKLRKLKCRQIIIIPMYDDIHADPDTLFLRFRNFSFISFCNALNQRIVELGIKSKYFQFFIDPSSLPYKTDPFTELKGFFWQRTNDITWEHIRKLIEGSHFTSFHLHLALDPIWYREVLPSDEEMAKYHVTITRWFEKKEDYLSVLSGANVFFTPRLYEGIGMPVIEAMTMGKVVVAPDHPTMNEYITHGENGLLYNTDDLKPLDFSRAKTMASYARDFCCKGFENWQGSRMELVDYIAHHGTE